MTGDENYVILLEESISIQTTNAQWFRGGIWGQNARDDRRRKVGKTQGKKT